MEKLKSMKESLMAQAQSQMGNLANVDANELGEVIDMIKDLEEAIYYCTITKTMEKKEKEPQSMYYTVPTGYYRDVDRDMGKMYFDPGTYNMNNGNRMGFTDYNRGGSSNYAMNSNGNSSGSRNYTEMTYPYPIEMRDRREGRSPTSRRSYMEAKEMHLDKPTQMKELENYMQELSHDLTEMVEDASPEEKQLLQQKITALASKIK